MSLTATLDVAEARMHLQQLVKRIDQLTDEDKRIIRVWIPRARKVIDEIEALCQVKSPTMDDRLQELLDNPEFDPKRYYVVTLVQIDREVELFGRPLPFTPTGDRVTEMLNSVMVERIAHVYQVEDDGSLTMKR